MASRGYDWDDLRFVLHVAAAGTTSGAAGRLGTSQSTVVRRVAAFEEQLGVRLFDKRPSGYFPTDDLTALHPILDEMAEVAGRWERAVRARVRTTTGTVRFSAPEIVLSYVLPAVLRDFRERYPNVRLELATTDRAVDLAAGEADVALRGGRMPTGAGLFGRRLAYDRSVIAASRTYAAARPLPGTIAELADHPILWNDAVPSTHPLAAWFSAKVPAEAIVLRPDTAVATLMAVRGGLGLGTMPRFLAARDPELVIVPVEPDIPADELWILAHERSRDSGPVRQLMDYIASYVLSTNSPEAQRAA